MGPCFWPSLGEGKRRSCSPGCLPPESCVSIGGCRGGELFTVTLGRGPGMKPQMNSSCSRRSRLKQTASRAGRALRRGPELLEPGLEQEGCGASPGSCHAQVPHAGGVPAWGQWPRLLLRGCAVLPVSLVLVPRHPGTRHVKRRVSKLWKTALSFVALARAGRVGSCNIRGFAQAGTPVSPRGISGQSMLPWCPVFPLSHLLKILL